MSSESFSDFDGVSRRNESITTKSAPICSIWPRSHARSSALERSSPIASTYLNEAAVAPVGRSRWSTNILGPISLSM
jgi:hypothetical protein